MDYLLITALYIALFGVGIKLYRLSAKEKAMGEENELLKKLLLKEKKKLDQSKNAQSIMRLLRALEESFSSNATLEVEVEQLQKQLHAYSHQWTWMGEQPGLESEQTKQALKLQLNKHISIRSLTTGFDIAELILRKSQFSDLDEEDKQILKTEFLLIYQKSLLKAIDCLQVLKKPLPQTSIVAYELLDCLHTIELLENYFQAYAY